MLRSVLAAVAVGVVLGVMVGAVIVGVLWLAPCHVDTFGAAVVLLCPGVDALRLWPWPPVTPFFEPERAPSQLGRLTPARRGQITYKTQFLTITEHKINQFA